MAVTTWTAGQVLTAADLNDTLASKVDYATPTNAQTGTAYTFVAADAEKLTTASNGSAVTLTIPPASSVAWPDETILRVVNYGAGAVTIDGGSGVTVTNTSSTIAQYGAAVAIRTASDAWTVVPFGGGDVPAAEVSSPAATGQYTDGSGDTWDYYTFTSSGTLTVDTAGFADVLVVGGGGSGGADVNRGAGGGGAGGVLNASDVYLPAGILTVTVGAGGAKSPDTANLAMSGNGNGSRLGNFYGLGGGAGGAMGGYGGIPTAGNGGSGGGASATSITQTPGNGITGQGNDGGSSVGSSTIISRGGGGGGGAGSAGSNATTGAGGSGGAGISSSITGSAVTYGGGGGGAGGTSSGSGGSGGGGAGSTSGNATSGTANTGGGGGGAYANTFDSGAGGSGIVIVRVKV